MYLCKFDVLVVININLWLFIKSIRICGICRVDIRGFDFW